VPRTTQSSPLIRTESPGLASEAQVVATGWPAASNAPGTLDVGLESISLQISFRSAADAAAVAKSVAAMLVRTGNEGKVRKWISPEYVARRGVHPENTG